MPTNPMSAIFKLTGYRLEEDGSMSPLDVQHGRWLAMPERGGAR